jgi:antitoxin component YwqK of YwqJK toxin-antitoxin module
MMKKLSFLFLMSVVFQRAWSQENMKTDSFVTALTDGKAKCISITINNGESNITNCYFVDSKTIAKTFSKICNRLNGPFLEYYKNGQLEKHYNYVWGFEVGTFVSFYDNGLVKSIGSYSCIDTIRDLKQKTVQIKETSALFYSSTSSYTCYRDKEGEWKYYYSSGNLVHSKGDKEGEWIYYNAKGDVIKTEIYSQGRLIKK